MPYPTPSRSKAELEHLLVELLTGKPELVRELERAFQLYRHLIWERRDRDRLLGLLEDVATRVEVESFGPPSPSKKKSSRTP